MKAAAFGLLLFGAFGFVRHAVADDRFPVLKEIEPTAVERLQEVLEWERSFEDLPEEKLIAKLGRPDLTEEAGVNPVTQKRMHTLIYRLTRRSDLRFTIHDGAVAAVSVILIPSGNEDGPVDD